MRKKQEQMDAKVMERVCAICSWAEVYAPKVAQNLTESFYSSWDVHAELLEKEGIPPQQVEDDALDMVRKRIKETCCAFLSTGSRNYEEKPPVGFAYAVERFEKEKLLANAISIVKENGLLKDALSHLEQTDLPLTEDEKITMLLQSPDVVPPRHFQVKAMLSLPVVDAETKRKKNMRLPVKVVVAGNEVKEITLIKQQEAQKQHD
ncbi:MAG: hypothetical protein E7013_05215 [Alphaproteobacteria bacterium]|nr:hypothetical protein [Alphaproteobacteria bacterium]